jgi:RNA polymerase sigma-70 factor (ECF subfamily)
MPDLYLYPEDDLLTKVSAGDETAFRQLFLMYHQQLGTHIFRITNSVDIAEEIVHDIFLKIWINREKLVGVRNFKAYLFVISKNYTLNCLRKLSREQIHKKEWEDNFIKIAAYENDNFYMYYCLLDQAINQLPPQQQKVYLLSRHERLRYAEIAHQLNISSETVKKYLQIATASIAAYLRTNSEVSLILLFASDFF